MTQCHLPPCLNQYFCLTYGVCSYGNWSAAQAQYNNPYAGIGSAFGTQLSALAHQQASFLAQQQSFANALAGQALVPQIPAPVEPLENVGIQVGEIIGWRIWRYVQGYLTSYSADTAWVPGEALQSKPPDDHGAVGIWAFKEKGKALKKMLDSGPNYVFGSISMWGEIVEHEDGYRAEFARIVSLDGMTDEMTRFFAKLRARRLAELRRLYLP